MSWLLDADVPSQPTKKKGHAAVIRILGFNVSVAHVWAEQQHQLQVAGLPMPVEDSYIAAIARRHDLTIATVNVQHFKRPGIKVFNPFEESDA